jgi:hypothetical protein
MGKSNRSALSEKENAIVKDNSHFLLFSFNDDSFEFENEFMVSAGGTN